MSNTPAPSPIGAAYVATVTAFPVTHPTMRRVRLSGRQVALLDGLEIPLAIDGTSRRTPCTQAEIAIQDAARTILPEREVCAVLWRDSNEGELFVLCGGSFVAVANLSVAPARVVEVAA